MARETINAKNAPAAVVADMYMQLKQETHYTHQDSLA